MEVESGPQDEPGHYIFITSVVIVPRFTLMHVELVAPGFSLTASRSDGPPANTHAVECPRRNGSSVSPGPLPGARQDLPAPS